MDGWKTGWFHEWTEKRGFRNKTQNIQYNLEVQLVYLTALFGFMFRALFQMYSWL
jgi:hypothetical protein